MKKFFTLLLAIIFLPTICFAANLLGEEDKVTLNDLRNNPLNYLAVGSSDREISLYIDKNSIHVQEYAPPNYIIAFTEVAYSVPINAKSPSEISARTYLVRYKYNLDEQKMYRELKDSDENFIEWQEVIPVSSGADIPFTAKGEVAFCLAYNRSFYDEPMTIYLQFYLKNKRWLTFAGRD